MTSPERQRIGRDAIPITEEGLEQLQAELRELMSVRRPAAVERVRAVREGVGDPFESDEYGQALDELRALEARIEELRAIVSRAEPIRRGPESDVVGLGSEVKLSFEEGGEETYRLVGWAEADPRQGRVSTEAPLGRALIGHRAGDEVEWEAAGGVARARILEVR